MSKNITKQIANFLSLFSQDVVSQLTPEHREDAQFPDFLHISRDHGVKEMIPRISTRQNEKEDVTVPRVVGAPTLVGCIVGYQTIISDYENLPKAAERNREWLGGYYIYALDYEWRFKVTKKLVPDVTESDEMWLLNYNVDNKSYKPRKIGKFFAVESRTDFTAGTGKDNSKSAIDFFFEIKRDGKVDLSATKWLGPGFWKVTIPYVKKLGNASVSWQRDSDFVVQPIEPAAYYNAKKLTANLLGFQDNPYQF